MPCEDCLDRGWVATASLGGELVAVRCDCPAGAALMMVPTMGQLDEPERKLLGAIAGQVMRTLVIRPGPVKVRDGADELVGENSLPFRVKAR